MCGIGGIISFAPFKDERLAEARRICRALHVALDVRGTDASGIVSIKMHPYDTLIHKGPVDSEDLVKTAEWNATFTNGTNAVLLHTRAATTGDKKDNTNNHPFMSKQSGSVLIHNGVIRNHNTLTKTHALPVDGECDSEVILRMIETHGFDRGVKALTGSAAIAVTMPQWSSIVLWRGNSSPLVLAYVKELDAYVFASTRDILDSVLGANVTRRVGCLSFERTMPRYTYGVAVFDEGTKATFNFTNNALTARRGVNMTDQYAAMLKKWSDEPVVQSSVVPDHSALWVPSFNINDKDSIWNHYGG